MTQWEYRLEESPGASKLAAFLDDESTKSWDLVAVIEDRLVLRRKVPNPA